MSHRISRLRANKLFAKEKELQQLQCEGKPLPKSNRRHKKYLMQIKRHDGYLARMKQRIKDNFGILPKHFEESDK